MNSNMKFLLILLFLLLNTVYVRSQNVGMKPVFPQLDDAIAQSPSYVNKHEKKINKLRDEYHKSNDNNTKYNLAFMLYKNYMSYMNDSAIVYLNRCIDIADKMNRKNMAGDCRALLAFQCSSSGMYTEALGILGEISPAYLDKKGLSDYYIAYGHVYRELGYYTKLYDLKETYTAISRKYINLLFENADKNSEDYLLQKELIAFNENKLGEALAFNNKRMAKVKRGSRQYALVTYYRHLIYREQGNMTVAKYWLVESAVSDIKNAVMDQASLWNLADILNHEGDFERSYRYIRFSWDCNNHFNTRMRNWQISPMLSVIDSNYQKQIKKTNQDLIKFIFVISVLTLLLLALFVFVYKQKKKLSVARNELKCTNEKLAMLNENLSHTNAQLNESNCVKEEYIGRFLSLCSQYVDKLDEYRKLVNKKLKNKEYESLFHISRSTEFKEKELDDLYSNFDTVFIHLFPNFVDDFNSMLKPEVQIHPKDMNKLTTDIRIFALIRLGIEDSSKIAEFLHYSVNTIYNYRARIKNGALTDRENFEKHVKEIGMPK